MAELAVVICSLNGASGVDRCLRSLARQYVRGGLEAVVVDDGSTDDTSAVARSHGARVVRHEHNRGLAAARNSGVLAAGAPLVAFLDDDCVPEPGWAAALCGAYERDVVGVGGPVLPSGPPGFMARHIERHNPLVPLELELVRSEALPYRVWLYLRRQWRTDAPGGRRRVHALVGANMSFRRQALLDVGLFDPNFTFGAEELDLCLRLGGQRLVIEPAARVVHEFAPSLGDSLRRSRAYGLGSARLWRKWPSLRPTVYPFPLVVGGLLAIAPRAPRALVAAMALPHLMFPAGLRQALGERDPEPLLDPYVQLAWEAADSVGFVEGVWRSRVLGTEPAGQDAIEQEAQAEVVSAA